MGECRADDGQLVRRTLNKPSDNTNVKGCEREFQVVIIQSGHTLKVTSGFVDIFNLLRGKMIYFYDRGV